jgi:hypothetical protein
MPAASSMLSISYMSAVLCKVLSGHVIYRFYMPTTRCYVKLYVFACVNQYICYSARFIMPVNISSSVSAYMPNALSHVLCVICRLSYAKARMPVYICWMPCASCYKFTVRSVICLSQYQFPHALSQILYASCSILAFICRHMSAKYLLWYAKFAYMPVAVYLHLYAGTWVPNICCDMPSLLICQLQYTCIYMPAHECQISVVICQVCLDASCSILAFICRHMSAKYLLWYAKFAYMPVAVCLHLYAGTWVPSSSLWVAKLAYMSNCYISVYMPSALFQELYAECNGLYAKLHVLDWNMPNAMTIAMSF